jgi:transcriptional regulator with XRE-family HTH domain
MQLRIRYWRLKRGMKLRELAKRTGISYPMLSAYEIGTNDPSLPRLVTIADALSVTVDELLQRQEESSNARDEHAPDFSPAALAPTSTGEA